MNRYKRIIIGIDQSYKDTGICVIADGVLKDMRHIELSKLKDNSARRRKLNKSLHCLLDSIQGRADSTVCIIERIRLRSQGFINIDYIKSIGALNSIIVDICQDHGVEVFSVDTRHWKAKVVGTSKPQSNKYNVPPEKWPTIRWVIDNGWENFILQNHGEKCQKKNGVFKKDGLIMSYNDNAADSCGIAWYGEKYGINEIESGQIVMLKREN
jgi:hypothetical protein